MLYSLAQLPWSFWLPLMFLQGAIIGSFLNVIIYRMPAGLSIAWPPSSCPRCGTRIKLRDNLPIVGWLLLRGKCRTCSQPIARRYPIVELTCAVLFAQLGWAEALELGRFLPGEVWTVPAAWQIYGNHLLLVCGLLVTMWIEHDGFALPWRMVLVWLAIAVPLGAFWPAIHPISPPIHNATIKLEAGTPLVGMLDGVAGLLVGATLGALAGLGTGQGPSRLAGRNTMVVALAAVGAQLGWQAVAALGAVTMALVLLTAMFRAGVRTLQNMPNTGWLFLATLVWLFKWKSIVARWPWLGAEANYRTLAMGAVAVFTCSVVAWMLRPRADALPASKPEQIAEPVADSSVQEGISKEIGDSGKENG